VHFKKGKDKNTNKIKVISHVTLKMDLELKIQGVADFLPQLK
jgi:hypothetical protein